MRPPMKLFGMRGSREFARSVASHLGPDVSVATHEEDYFDDGETYCRSSVNVRGADVFVIQSLYSCQDERVSDKLIKLLNFLGALHDASAGRVTVIAPYLAYSRQDRKTKSREGVVTKYLARWLESMGADRLLTIDIHNLAAFQNSHWDCLTDELAAKNLMARWVADNVGKADDLCVLSPDEGSIRRNRLFRNKLSQLTGVDIPVAVVDKTHVGRAIQGHAIVGNVKGKRVVMVDDIIASGKTMCEAKNLVEADGGEVWAICATHGLFVGKASDNLRGFPRIVVTDTVSPYRLQGEAREKVVTVSVARLFAQAIRRIHEEDSISDLLA